MILDSLSVSVWISSYLELRRSKHVRFMALSHRAHDFGRSFNRSVSDLYYLAFPSDHTVLQCLVYGVYLVGTFQTGLALHDIYIIYSTRYGWIRPDMPKDQPAWNSGLYFTITIPICGSIGNSPSPFVSNPKPY